MSRHARERWHERIGKPAHVDTFRQAVLIPDRFALTLWGSWKAQLTARRQGSAGRSTAFRVTSAAVLVCRGDVVATVFALPVEQLAQVLVWLMLGQWVEDD